MSVPRKEANFVVLPVRCLAISEYRWTQIRLDH